jgi:hypothetical protein
MMVSALAEIVSAGAPLGTAESRVTVVQGD